MDNTEKYFIPIDVSTEQNGTRLANFKGNDGTYTSFPVTQQDLIGIEQFKTTCMENFCIFVRSVIEMTDSERFRIFREHDAKTIILNSSVAEIIRGVNTFHNEPKKGQIWKGKETGYRIIITKYDSETAYLSYIDRRMSSGSCELIYLMEYFYNTGETFNIDPLKNALEY